VDVIGASADQLPTLSGRPVPPGVVAHGRVDDAVRDRLLARADVLAVPSLRSESFGIVLLEGMAAGLPVVATSVGGYPDLLPPEAGRLVPPGDADALADALRALLADDAARERMGAAGRRLAARYDWSEVAARVAAVYERVLRRRTN
jgi:phosphatidylinositol alpha-mannosyltransferase